MTYQTIRVIMPLFIAISLLSGCGKTEEPETPISPKPIPVSPSPISSLPTSPSPQVTTTPIAASLKSQNEKGTVSGTPTKATKQPEVKCASTDVKGNIGKKGKIYHSPGTNGYEGVKAEACFKDIASAEKAGYRAPK